MKFDNEHDEHVYTLTLDGFTDQGEGEASVGPGWFCSVDLDPEEDAEHIAWYETRHLIIHENNEGHVSVMVYLGDEAEEKRNRAYDQLVRLYLLAAAGIDSEEARLALSGYLECARWSSHDDGGDPFDAAKYDGISWSEDAQDAAQSDVYRFIAEHVVAARHFMDATVPQLGWGQVGHDLWLTRNGHGAGYWDRGYAGPAIDTLVEGAKALGEVHICLSDDNELEFS